MRIIGLSILVVGLCIIFFLGLVWGGITASKAQDPELGFGQPSGWCRWEVYNPWSPMFADPSTGWVPIEQVPAEYQKYNQSKRHHCSVEVQVSPGGTDYVKWDAPAQ